MRKKTYLLLVLWLCTNPTLFALQDSTEQDMPLGRTGLAVYKSEKLHRSFLELSEYQHPDTWDRGLKLCAQKQKEILEADRAIEILPYYQREYYDLFQLYAGESLPKNEQAWFHGFFFEFYAGRVETGESFNGANLDMGEKELSHRIRLLAAYARNDYPAVLHHLEEFLAFDPESFPALSLKGEISYGKMDWEECISCYSKIISSSADYAYGYFIRGLAHSAGNNPMESRADLEKTLELFQDNPYANDRLGYLYRDEKRYEKAIPYLRRSINMGLGNADAAAAIGSMYNDMGESDSALYYYKMALDMKPEDPELNRYLADFYYWRGEYSIAVFIYNKILTRDPDYSPALRSRGNAFMHQNKYTQAMADFERVRSLEPKDANNLYKIGYCHMVQGENVIAREFMEEGLALDSSVPGLLTNLAWVCYSLNDFDSSIEYSNMALEIDSVTQTTLFNHALYLLRLGKEEESYALYQEILADNPDADLSGPAMDLQDLIDRGIMKKQARYVRQKILKLD